MFAVIALICFILALFGVAPAGLDMTILGLAFGSPLAYPAWHRQ